MHSQNHIGVKKAYIDSPFDDDGPEERKPFANLIEALGGPDEASMGREYPHFLSLLDPFESDEGQESPAQLPTDVLQGIVDAYRNRRALGDERNRHLDMTNFMAEMTGMNQKGIARTSSGDTYALPSMSEEHGAQEYRDITDELGLRRDEIEEVRQNVPGLYQPLRIEEIHDLRGPAVPTINTPDDITLDDWLLPEEQELLLSEPMDIAYQLLKERVSPAAIRHKLEYDTNYESNPKRVKYREQLNQERRRRGIYGSGNQMDISHTQGNKLSLEGQHANRARHFKNRGTLRRVRVR